MRTTLKEHLIKKAKFDYYLNNGFEEGKGALQSFIDKIPAITQTILQGKEMTLGDKVIIYDSTNVLDDIKIMSTRWGGTIALMRRHLTPSQVSVAESNQSAVVTLSAQLEKLLLELEKACDSNHGGWAKVLEDVKTMKMDKNTRKLATRALLMELETLANITFDI
jgi:hypothetical protein